MKLTRRELVGGGLFVGATLAARQAGAQTQGTQALTSSQAPASPPMASSVGRGERGLVVPNGALLPSSRKRDARVFHLIAEEFDHEIMKGLVIKAWGFNGHTPGPVIEGIVGERVVIYVSNKLPAPTSVHWHGLVLPSGMDGVAGLHQRRIAPGQTFRYEFVLDRAGTFMYHSQCDEMTQIALGMVGMLIVRPRGDRGADREYSLMSHEWKILPGAARPDPSAMSDFNVLTFNGKAFPATEPLHAELGETVRIHLGNMGPMDHHSIHIHGTWFDVVATDGGVVPRSARVPETTTLLPVGATRTIEFVARAPGDWPLHCHMTHHAMNQMGHGSPNMVGVDTRGVGGQIMRHAPGYMPMGQTGMWDMAEMEMPVPANSVAMRGGLGPHGIIDMGGMFTVIKVRRQGDTFDGWYPHGGDATAREASAADLAADGIVLK
ncbi:MAG: copper oxidase [Myxococcales bacterium]|nr:copper oxidase [Myxococcales bacterium]